MTKVNAESRHFKMVFFLWVVFKAKYLRINIRWSIKKDQINEKLTSKMPGTCSSQMSRDSISNSTNLFIRHSIKSIYWIHIQKKKNKTSNRMDHLIDRYNKYYLFYYKSWLNNIIIILFSICTYVYAPIYVHIIILWGH